MKRISILLILFIPFLSLYAPNLSKEYIEAQKERKFLRDEKNRLFELVIEEIKKAESLRLSKYICPSGQETIGYGHMIREGESYPTITKEKAEELLIQDFNEVYNYLDSSLSWHKRLAIAKFCYNIGIGNYNKSKLKKYVDSDKSIDELIIKYCHYKKNRQYIKSNWLLKQRIFELKIYNYEINT